MEIVFPSMAKGDIVGNMAVFKLSLMAVFKLSLMDKVNSTF